MSLGLSRVLKSRLRTKQLRERWRQWAENRFARKGARLLLNFMIASIQTYFDSWRRRIKLLAALVAVRENVVRRPRLRKSLKHWRFVYRERWRIARERRSAMARWARFTWRRVRLRSHYARAEIFQQSRAQSAAINRWFDRSMKRTAIAKANEQALEYYRTTQLQDACKQWQTHLKYQRRALRKFADIFVGAVSSAFLREIVISWRRLVVYRSIVAQKIARGLFSSGLYLQQRCIRAWVELLQVYGHDRLRHLRRAFRAFGVFILLSRREKELVLARATAFANAKSMKRVLAVALGRVARAQLRRQRGASARLHREVFQERKAFEYFRMMLGRHDYQSTQLEFGTSHNNDFLRRRALRLMQRHVSMNKQTSDLRASVAQILNSGRRGFAWASWRNAQRRQSIRHSAATTLLQRAECRLRLNRWNHFRRKTVAERDTFLAVQATAARSRASRIFTHWHRAQLRKVRLEGICRQVLRAWVRRYTSRAFEIWHKTKVMLQHVSKLFNKQVEANSLAILRRIQSYSASAKAERLAAMAVSIRARKTSWRRTWKEWRKQYQVMRCARRLSGQLTQASFKAWAEITATAQRERSFINRARTFLQDNRRLRGMWRRVLSSVVSRALNSWIQYFIFRRSRRFKLRVGERAHTRKMCQQAVTSWRREHIAKQMWRKAVLCDARLTKVRMWPWLMLALELSLRQAYDMRRADYHWSYRALKSSIMTWVNYVESCRHQRARIQVLVHAEALHVLGAAVFAWRLFCQRRADLTRRAHAVALLRSERILSLRFRSWNHVYRYHRHCREIANVRLRIKASLFRLKLQRMLVRWSDYCDYQARLATATQFVEQRHQLFLSFAYMRRWQNSFAEAMKQYQPSERWIRARCRLFVNRLSYAVTRRRKLDFAVDRMVRSHLARTLLKLRQFAVLKRVRRNGIKQRAELCSCTKITTTKRSTFQIWRTEYRCRIIRYSLLCAWLFRSWVRFSRQSIEERATLRLSDDYIARKAISCWAKATRASLARAEAEIKLQARSNILVSKLQQKALNLMIERVAGLSLMRHCFEVLFNLVSSQKMERRILQNEQRDALACWVRISATKSMLAHRACFSPKSLILTDLLLSSNHPFLRLSSVYAAVKLQKIWLAHAPSDRIAKGVWDSINCFAGSSNEASRLP